VKEVAGDIEVMQTPLYYNLPDGTVQTCDYTAIIRKPTVDDPSHKVFGITTEKWHHIPYVVLAQAMDELGKTYKVETCGVIEDGSLCFLSLRGPDFAVKGDEIQDYFIINLSNQPGKAHRALAAPVRVVCYNTNMLASERASIAINVPHSADAKERLNLAATLVAKFKETSQRTREAFELLASVQAPPEALVRIASAAFPDPAIPAELRLLNSALTSNEQGALREALGDRFDRIVRAQEHYDREKARVEARRSAVQDRFGVFEPRNLRGTLWAAYNAVTEVADWREGSGADVGSLWGGRAREKAAAFGAAMQLVSSN